MTDLAAFLRARLDEDELDALKRDDDDQRRRSLREVAAKRKIVGRCEHNLAYEDHGWSVAEPVLRDLAAVYSDHPDYDPKCATP